MRVQLGTNRFPQGFPLKGRTILCAVDCCASLKACFDDKN